MTINFLGSNKKAFGAQGYTDMAKSAEKNMHNQTNMNAIGDILDNASAMTLFNTDLKIAAETMAHRDMEVTMTADVFAVKEQAMAHDINMENLQQRNKIALEEKKSELKMKEADGTPVKGAFAAASDHKIKQETVDNFNIVGSMYTFLGDGYNSNNIASMTEKEILAFMDSPNVVDRDKLKIAYKDAKAVEKKHKVAANIAALKSVEKGSDVDFSKLNWEEMDAETYNGLKRNLSADQFADLDVPTGAKYLGQGVPLMFTYPKSSFRYYNENDQWHRFDPVKHTDEIVVGDDNIWNLDTKAVVEK